MASMINNGQCPSVRSTVPGGFMTCTKPLDHADRIHVAGVFSWVDDDDWQGYCETAARNALRRGDRAAHDRWLVLAQDRWGA